jgi:hypothetical protein
MEMPDHGKAAEGFNKLLLAPTYLVYEILTALVPGVLFCTLLIGKGFNAPTAVLSTTLLGYKTKILLGLVISYFTGRFFRSFVEPVVFLVVERKLKKIAAAPLSSASIDAIQAIFLGALALPKLFEKIPAVDLLVLTFSNAVFSYTTGIMLITSGMIRGDGYLRAVELIVGIVFLLREVITFNRILDGLLIALGGIIDVKVVAGPIAQLFAILKKAQQAATSAEAVTSAPANPAERVPDSKS